MKAVDTNVLTRYLIGDDAKQLRAARLLIDGGVIVPQTVLLETAWVLESAYGLSTKEVADLLRALFRVTTVSVVDPPQVKEALRLYEAGLDFADAMHTVTSPVDQLRTFDKNFVKRAKRAKTKIVVEGL